MTKLFVEDKKTAFMCCVDGIDFPTREGQRGKVGDFMCCVDGIDFKTRKGQKGNPNPNSLVAEHSK